MIKLRYNLWIALFAIVGTVNASSPSFKETLKREVKETFQVIDGVSLGVQNKYGNIEIMTWDKNQIDVHVLIKVKANNTKKAKTFIDGINIDFSSSSSKVGMKTVYPDQDNSSWWDSWWSKSNNIEYEVHYTINAPQSISTTLITKYGNISQESIEGSCNITNKYGDVFLSDIGEDLVFNLGYGKAKIGSVDDANLVVKYSTIKMANCKDISLDTKYSDYKFGACGSMTIDSKYDEFDIQSAESIKNHGKYDDFEIGMIGKMDIGTKYTDIKIKKLDKSFLFDGKYGSIKIRNTGELERVKIETKYTDVYLGIDHDYHLDFYGDRSGLRVDKPYDKFQKDEDGNEVHAIVARGSKSSGADMEVKMKYGSLRIENNGGE